MIAVGWISEWHGYDRMIQGLHLFQTDHPEIEVHLHIVGEGPHLDKIIELVKSEKCENLLTFWGRREGRELDEIFSKCQLGISSLGLHRIGLQEAQPLKSREYIARGLPLLQSSCASDNTMSGLPGVICVEADESTVNLESVYLQTQGFYDIGGCAIHRNYARKNFDWKVLAGSQFSRMEKICREKSLEEKTSKG